MGLVTNLGEHRQDRPSLSAAIYARLVPSRAGRVGVVGSEPAVLRMNLTSEEEVFVIKNSIPRVLMTAAIMRNLCPY